jgi:DNA-binding transcriptional MerR regulator
MLIGKLATETGVNIETIRYYERVELLSARRALTAGIASTTRTTYSV